MGFEDGVFDDVRPMVENISKKTGLSPEEVFKHLERVTSDTSMRQLAALEKAGREKNSRPQLSVVPN